MTCLRCGDVCICVGEDGREAGAVQPHLESDADKVSPRLQSETRATDSETTGSTQNRFVASLEIPGESSRPPFVVDQPGDDLDHGEGPAQPEDQRQRMQEIEITAACGDRPLRLALLEDPSPSAWRTEVSERLHRYRARRRSRGPRYPSLPLKFETGASIRPVENSSSTGSAQFSRMSLTASRRAVAVDRMELGRAEIESEPNPVATDGAGAQPEPEDLEFRSSETTAKIIEFPRFVYAAPVSVHELADPVVDRPRILEAPEVVPPPPALGGITIEETHVREPERRLGIDMPLQPAPLDKRIQAVIIDFIIVLLAEAGFGTIVYHITGARPPLAQIAGFGACLAGFLWAAYQYLMIVYSGATPGARMMKLQMQRFDGSLPGRRVRRWRALASLLSGISLGMGYAWQFLDEDGLCWHERVTKTYLAPETRI